MSQALSVFDGRTPKNEERLKLIIESREWQLQLTNFNLRDLLAVK